MAAVKDEHETEVSTSFVRLRPKIIISLAMVMLLGFFVHKLWERYEPTVSQHPQYQLTADQIHLPPSPPWIRVDIGSEVFREAGLGGNLSLLDDGSLLKQIKQALEFHPWVESVSGVAKRLPAGVDVQLTYRQPVAAVESINGQSYQLLPVDRNGVRLPENDLTEPERLYLPRITNILKPPMVGQRWEDTRVLSGLRLVGGLAEVWQTMKLVEIVPTPSHQPYSGQTELWNFEILTSGGTRILWGAAPGEEVAGELNFVTKLESLRNYTATNNNLGTIDGPKTIDVRSEFSIHPRTAQEKREARLALNNKKDRLESSQKGTEEKAVEQTLH